MIRVLLADDQRLVRVRFQSTLDNEADITVVAETGDGAQATTVDLDDEVYRALRAGASGFLVKDTAPAELIHAVRVVADGGELLRPSNTRRLIAEFASPIVRPSAAPRPASLTEREREVLGLIAAGLSDREIAGRLALSPAAARRMSAGS